jgi:hypothetical protein
MTRKLAALLPESHQGMIVTSPISRALASAGFFACFVHCTNTGNIQLQWLSSGDNNITNGEIRT